MSTAGAQPQRRAVKSRTFSRDLLVRTARTFVQGFLGVVTVDAFSAGFDATFLETLGMGALAGVFAILTAFAGKSVGNPEDASFLSKKQPVAGEPTAGPGAASSR